MKAVGISPEALVGLFQALCSDRGELSLRGAQYAHWMVSSRE